MNAEVKRYTAPADLLQVVKGYQTHAHYTCGDQMALIAVKDRAARETWRVRVQAPGRPDTTKFFTGAGSLDRAKTYAYHAVQPKLTKEEVDKLL